MHWIYAANIWGIYVSWKVSVRPSGAKLRNVHCVIYNCGGGTIPPELCVTRLKPDIVIVDEIKKKLHIYELTVPLNMNIDQRNREKTQKYTPFLTDITNYTCTLNCFEVSSTGYINPRNKLTLTTLSPIFTSYYWSPCYPA